MRKTQKTTNINYYNEENIEEFLDDDAISIEEAGFMSGYIRGEII